MNVAKKAVDSRTLWQSIFAIALWAGVTALGVPIPIELIQILVGGIAVKEAAGKIKAKPKE